MSLDHPDRMALGEALALVEGAGAPAWIEPGAPAGHPPAPTPWEYDDDALARAFGCVPRSECRQRCEREEAAAMEKWHRAREERENRKRARLELERQRERERREVWRERERLERERYANSWQGRDDARLRASVERDQLAWRIREAEDDKIHMAWLAKQPQERSDGRYP